MNSFRARHRTHFPPNRWPNNQNDMSPIMKNGNRLSNPGMNSDGQTTDKLNDHLGMSSAQFPKSVPITMTVMNRNMQKYGPDKTGNVSARETRKKTMAWW